MASGLAHGPGAGSVSGPAADVCVIVDQSLSPDEWRSYAHEISAEAGDPAAAQALLDRWKKIAGMRTGSAEPFAQRLRTLGLSEETALERLLPRRMKATGAPPRWALVIEHAFSRTADECRSAIDWIGRETPAEREAFELDRYPGPAFPDLIAPFVAEFCARFRSEVSGRFSGLSPAAVPSVARSLARRLSAICGRTMAYELRLAREAGSLAGETPEARYNHFVSSRLADPASRRELFLRYPVLSRILATMTMNYIDATNEVIERAARDRESIVSQLPGGVDPGAIRLFLAGMSDLHNGGRSAWILEFENGSRVVYKPRSFTSDEAYSGVVQWLNARHPSVDLRVPRSVARDGYGWSEFIAAKPCESEEALARYFRRQGFHAALIYFLCGLDFHAENFIAHGEFPVPVDLEGLASPFVAVPPPEIADLPPALRSLQFTVVTSLLLPYWRAGDRSRPLYTASGIGGSGDRLWPTKRPRWIHLNSDLFSIEFNYPRFDFQTSVPRFEGRAAAPDIVEIERGFREAWRIIAGARDELLADAAPFAAFRDLRSRYLIRDTQEYEDILFWTTAPDLLASGAAYDVALETLAGSVPVFFTGASIPEIVDEEKKCLWDRDVPIAAGSARETGITLPGSRTFGPVVPAPMVEQMRRRLEEADDRELEWECALIRSTFAMSLEKTAPKGDPSRSGQPGRILERAVLIGEDIERNAVRSRDYTGWLGFVRFAGTGARVQMVQTEPWSLNGDAGNALFLINLAKATGDSRFEETGRAALASGVRLLEAILSGQLRNLVGVSGYVGYFGLVYAMAAAGAQLEDPALIDEALRVALNYPAGSIETEQNPDFLTGAAGPVAILSWLHSLTGDARALDLARMFAGSIARRSVDGARNGWQVPFFKRPLLGMAHGSAGIAMALARLHQQTADERYRDAALAGIGHETAHFQPADGQWPNFQEEPGRISYMTGWCAGAAGIGLARLATLKYGLDNPEIRADVEAAAAATRRNLGGMQHHACCGESGRIVFMAAAAHALNRPELHAEAAQAALAMIEQYESQGYWYLQEFCERLAIPGLLAGVPGVGMALLSLVRPAVSGVLTLC